ncbi:MAG: hypothetical protein QM535_08640 [Limnohabitans sp.]|nr:hypothetical protein [Limnohabitans sp.]
MIEYYTYIDVLNLVSNSNQKTMYLRLFLVLFFISNCSFSQIKKQEHKDFRSPKEIEQEKVITKMKEHFKNNYLFAKDDFYAITVNSTVNNAPFYTFNGNSKLQEISPISCESKYELNKEKLQQYKQAENSIFKKERAPREIIPFYLVAVFSKLQNIYENYNVFYAKDFSYNLIQNGNSEFYELSFRSKNPKIPVSGKIILDKKTYIPQSLQYSIETDYTFEMSSDNFNYKKSTGYLVKVVKEWVKIDFKNTGNQFIVAKYVSEFEFKNEQNNQQQSINGDSGFSRITLEHTEQQPKICHQTFNLNNLE